MDLLGEDDSDGNKVSLKINTEYAKSYERWRKKEELQKLKDKYGDDAVEESSSSEEEDEDAVELTEDVEKDFFKTLSCLKEKNPVIYDESVRFFKEKEKVGDGLTKTKKKEEPLTMATYQRKMLLETGGTVPEEESPRKFEDLPLVDQEKAIKASFQDALQDSDSDDDGLLMKKEKTAEERAKDDADYRQWLAGQDAAVALEDAQGMKGLRDYWTDPKLDEGEKFLRDYILNHRYLEKDQDGHPDNVLSSDSEAEVAAQEDFEHKFNFRFEEPDQDFIKRYPRTVEQSLRKKDEKRKEKREALKARKEAERAKKDEELKRLKALKRAEIIEKIAKLKQITGNEDLPFQEEDIEGEFNPDEHDQRMSQLFSEEFYGDAVDEEKPRFDDLDEELEIENWDKWDGTATEAEELHCEDPGFNMDADYDAAMETQRELVDNTKKRRKRRQSKFAEAASKPKPVFDPKSKSFEQYLDEYYGLDYEDLIGDIPCRFKYRKTVPNDFGLSIEEILAAPDKELNKWVSVKKIMKRRGEAQEMYDVQAYRKKAQNLQNKMQCLPSLFTPPEEEEEQEHVKKRKKKKGDLGVSGKGLEALDNPINEEKTKKRKMDVNYQNEENDIIKLKKKRKVAPGDVELAQDGTPLKTKKKAKLEVEGGVSNELLDNKIKNKVNNEVAMEVGEPMKEEDSQETSRGNLVSNSLKKLKKKKDVPEKKQLTESKTKGKLKETPSALPNSVGMKKTKKKKAVGNSNAETLQPVSIKNVRVGEPIQVQEESQEACNGKIVSNVLKKKLKKQKEVSSDGAVPKKKQLPEAKTKGKLKETLSALPNLVGKKKTKKNVDGNAKAQTSHPVNGKTFSGESGGKKFHSKMSNKFSKGNSEKKGGAFGNTEEGVVCNISDARLKSYGLNPKKFRNKLKYGKVK